MSGIAFSRRAVFGMLVLLSNFDVILQEITNQVSGPNSKTISLYVTAQDVRGKLIEDLKSEDLLVMEGKIPQRIEVLKKAGEVPLSVGLLIDASGSRRDQFPGGEHDGASQLLLAITGMGGSAFVEVFAKTIQLQKVMTSDAKQLQAALEEALAINRWGPSSPYEAIEQACIRRLSGQEGRRVIVITTDGYDNTSLLLNPKNTTKPIKSGDLAKTLAEQETILYAIFPKDRTDTIPRAVLQKGMKTMNSLSEATGGRAFVADSVANFTEAFEQIAEELRGQYLIEYTPNPPPSPGSIRAVRVQSTHKEIVVRSRTSYVMPAKQKN